VAGARVPISSLVIGEGGSGGALALASPTNQWITPDAHFSVIAPEDATAILKHDPEQAPMIADRLRLRPQDLLELGIVASIARPPGQAACAARGRAAIASSPAHATPSC
jgi:acetyl-CoA carboxylase alpha subunit